MNRRAFLELTMRCVGLAAIAGPLAACGGTSASGKKAPARIGYMGSATSSGAFQPLMRALSALGYVEGENVAYETRFPAGATELEQSAADLVRVKPDVVVTFGENAALAMQKATHTVPVVFENAFDPIGQGLVNSFARPGGNLTGPSAMVPELGAKWLELLRAVAPGVTRVAAVWNSLNTSMNSLWKGAEPAARGAEQRLNVHPAPMPTGMAGAVEAVAADKAEAIVVLWDPGLGQGMDQLIDYVTRNRVPTISQLRQFAAAGGLLVYGPNQQEVRSTIASYVDKILKGAKPADLPVEQPTKFDFIVNLKAASAMGLSIPPSVLSQATEVIQ